MVTIKIEGMTCGHCTSAVEQALGKVPGVREIIEVNLERGEARVEGDASPDQLVAAIQEEGFTAQIT